MIFFFSTSPPPPPALVGFVSPALHNNRARQPEYVWKTLLTTDDDDDQEDGDLQSDIRDCCAASVCPEEAGPC